MTCYCISLPEYDYYIPGRSLSRKIRPVTKTIDRANLRELLRCEVCGTYWRIDSNKKPYERFVWKVGGYRPDWAATNFTEQEKAFLLHHRGGETDGKCIWHGCVKRRVLGVVYCIDHLYDSGARK